MGVVGKIRNLNLNYIVKRMVQKKKWPVEDAKEAVRKYKNFLILRHLRPDLGIVPTPEIDEIWHDHILHTKRYAEDCKELFGSFMHHNPSSGTKKESKRLREEYLKTVQAYEETFHESYSYALEIHNWETL